MIKTWQAILASIGIFIAGAITGGAIAAGVAQGIAQRHRAAQIEHQKAADERAAEEASRAAEREAAIQAKTDGRLAALSAQIEAMRESRRGQPGQGSGQPNQLGMQLVRRLMGKIPFTPEQKAQVAPIVHRTNLELGRLRRETQMRTAVVVERTLDDIEEVLTPDQKTQFENLLRDRRKLLEQLINQPPRGPANRGGGPGIAGDGRTTWLGGERDGSGAQAAQATAAPPNASAAGGPSVPPGPASAPASSPAVGAASDPR